MRFRILFIFLVLLSLVASAQNSPQSVVGVWRGDSICQIKPSACHDEKALYRIKEVENAPGQLAITFSKVVDGNEVVMGTIADCGFNADTHAIKCTYETGTWLLTVSGDEMEGSLTLTDGTVFRKVKLKKQ